MAEDAELAPLVRFYGVPCQTERLRRLQDVFLDIAPWTPAEHRQGIVARRWPHLCVTWADDEWGSFDRLRRAIEAHGVECGGDECDDLFVGPWRPYRCRTGPYSWKNLRRRDRAHTYAQCMQGDE